MRTLKLLSAIGLTLALPVTAHAAAADFNNDGFDDLAIGIPAEDIGAITGAGAVNLLLGSADRPDGGRRSVLAPGRGRRAGHGRSRRPVRRRPGGR